MSIRTSRRTALKFGLATATALAMPQIMVRAAAAASHGGGLGMGAGPSRGFQLGDFQIATVYDGGMALEDPQPIFAADRSAEDVAALLTDNLLPADRFMQGFTPTVVKAGDEVVLFDAGNGAARREGGAGRLLAALPEAGVAPDEVTMVVITHMHPDHIGGLMEDGRPAFPNARYAAGQTEFDFWTSEDRMNTPAEGVAKLVESNVLPLAESMSFIGDGDEVVPGITAIAAPGHTPGHLAFMVESGGERLAITADAALHYVLSLQRPDWQVRFDADNERAAQTRRELFGMIASERIPFIGYHMPFPSIGYVEALGEGFRWIPATYQLDL